MHSLERNLTVFDGHCLPSSHPFEAYDFSDFQYGERVIRTTDGEDFGLLTLEDEVVNEVSEIIADIYKNSIDEMEQARRFDRVFGVSCDPIQGKGLNASVGITCPMCKSARVSYRESTPPRFKSFHIPVITHGNWLRLGKEERRSLIERELKAQNLL